ncbi:unnamed protein product [Orchesella dallaii]|uniref:Uncharacterized protein n=1 Tax=Orchesella dallaii TaxID=48710 RepID=A0ABP1QUT8_9HEXA
MSNMHTYIFQFDFYLCLTSVNERTYFCAMNTEMYIILFTICVISSFTISKATPKTISLPKCTNFTDTRREPKSDLLNLTNYFKENPSKDPSIYRLTGDVDLEKGRSCDRIEVAIIMALTEPWPDRKVGTESLKFSQPHLRYGAHITADGRYFDGLFYHNQTEFCVETITSHPVLHVDWYLNIRVCQLSQTSAESKRASSCVPKCCRPNRIIDRSSELCRQLKKGEPAWTPQICKKAECFYENDFCRAGYGLGVGVTCGENTIDIPLSKNVRLAPGKEKLELMYRLKNNQWKLYEHPYCVDGYVNGNSTRYKNDVTNQIIVVCESNAEEIKRFSIPRYIQLPSTAHKFNRPNFIVLISITAFIMYN